MPETEFRKHYEFWSQFKWGLESDLLAQSNMITLRSSQTLPAVSMKDIAMYSSGTAPVEVPDPDVMWDSIVSQFGSLG